MAAEALCGGMNYTRDVFVQQPLRQRCKGRVDDHVSGSGAGPRDVRHAQVRVPRALEPDDVSRFQIGGPANGLDGRAEGRDRVRACRGSRCLPWRRAASARSRARAARLASTACVAALPLAKRTARAPSPPSSAASTASQRCRVGALIREYTWSAPSSKVVERPIGGATSPSCEVLSSAASAWTAAVAGAQVDLCVLPISVDSGRARSASPLLGRYLCSSGRDMPRLEIALQESHGSKLGYRASLFCSKWLDGAGESRG